jgi:hypothetical protein
MYWITYVKFGAVGILSLALFSAGWSINGNRWELKYQQLVAEHQEAIQKAEKKSRETERDLQSAIDTERTTKDEKIRSLSNQLSSALVSLRQRPLRDTKPEPKNTCNSKGSDGSKLFREDAEFLVREAARADRAVNELQSCYRAYDSVRDLMNND